MDIEIECSFINFANNTKLCGVIDTLEGRDAIPRNKLEKWVCANLIKINRAKCKVLRVDWGSTKYKHMVGGEWIESSREEKDLSAGFLISACLQPRKPTKKVWATLKKKGIANLGS